MFQYFSKINYNFGNTGGIVPVVNIFKNIQVNLNDATQIEVQKLQSKERPDQLAYRLHGIFSQYWIFLVLNGIKNPLKMWYSLHEIYKLTF